MKKLTIIEWAFIFFAAAIIFYGICLLSSCSQNEEFYMGWEETYTPDTSITQHEYEQTDYIYILPITVPTDTAEAVTLPPCETLVHIDTPLFTVITLHFFNGEPLNYNWHFDGSTHTDGNLVNLLETIYPMYDYTYYEGNGSVTVFVEGVTNNNLFQGKIWTLDFIGQRALATAFGRSLFTYGALTFDEALFEARRRPSLTGLHSQNTDWTPEQDDAYARAALHTDKCKHGENHALFLHSNTSQSIRDSFTLFQWHHVNLTGSWEKS